LKFGVESRGRCELRIAYFAAGFVPDRPFGAVVASGVLREIVERAVVCGYLDPAEDRDARLLAVAADEVATLEAAPEAFVLPLPRDVRLRAALEHALAVPDAMPSVAELAVVAGMTLRTFERRFAHETGLTPRAWLQRARLRAATLALALGATITEAGLAGGYASLSAFIAAYRGVTGTTPGRRSSATFPFHPEPVEGWPGSDQVQRSAVTRPSTSSG
jgi:AraC-like DNA-binding protein